MKNVSIRHRKTVIISSFGLAFGLAGCNAEGFLAPGGSSENSSFESKQTGQVGSNIKGANSSVDPALADSDQLVDVDAILADVKDDEDFEASLELAVDELVLAGPDHSNRDVNTDFSQQDLKGANFSYSDVRDSNFKDTKLKGANFVGANLIDAQNFDVTKAMADGAKIDETTTLPKIEIVDEKASAIADASEDSDPSDKIVKKDKSVTKLIAHVKEAIVKVKEKRAARVAKIREIRKKIADLRSDVVQARHSHDDSLVSKLKSKIQAKKDRIVKIRTKVQHLNARIKDLRAQLADLRAKR